MRSNFPCILGSRLSGFLRSTPREWGDTGPCYLPGSVPWDKGGLARTWQTILPHPALSRQGRGFLTPSLDGRGKGEGDNSL